MDMDLRLGGAERMLLHHFFLPPPYFSVLFPSLTKLPLFQPTIFLTFVLSVLSPILSSGERSE